MIPMAPMNEDPPRDREGWITRLIAAFLYAAACDIPMPTYHRHALARLHLAKAMRRSQPAIWRRMWARPTSGEGTAAP